MGGYRKQEIKERFVGASVAQLRKTSMNNITVQVLAMLKTGSKTLQQSNRVKVRENLVKICHADMSILVSTGC